LAPFFHLFSLILEARSTLPRRLLTDTRPPAGFSAPAAARSGRVGHRRSVRVAHPLGSSLLFGACVGQASHFSSRSQWQLIIRRRTSVWMTPVSARVLRAPPSGILALFLHYRQIVLGSFCLSVLVFFSLVYRVTVYLCLV
jgi:hypothetical protein